MFKKLRCWLIKKLGGYVLTEEERLLLMTQIWIPRIQKASADKIEKDAVDMFINSFTSTL